MSALNRVVERAWRNEHLMSVLVELTYRCNLDCFFCYNDLGLVGRPLSLDQYLTLLEDLAAMQVLDLTLSGGEPLAHPHFLQIGERARALGFVVRLKSNGHALRGALLRQIRERINPFLVDVSLHGATAATHDRQTRVPGSFDRLLANVREAVGVGLHLRMNSTLTAWNEGEVEGMMDLAEELGVPLQFDTQVTPRDDGSREPLAISASREGMTRLFAVQTERALRRAVPPAPAGPVVASSGSEPPVPTDRHCGAGSSGLAIDPYGNVYPCVQWRRPVGNLHEKRIGEVWSTSPGLREVRGLTRQVKHSLAAHGEVAPLLAFCPGLAESITGSPLEVYPSARQRAEVVMAAQKDTMRPLPESEWPVRNDSTGPGEPVFGGE
jgi:MoaA/NifB/PqqE/SkfB family radical SAM enzyme